MLPLELDEYGRPKLPFVPASAPVLEAPGFVGMQMPGATAPGPIIPPVQQPVAAATVPQITALPPTQFRMPPPSPLVQESDLFHATEPMRTDPQFQRGRGTKVLDAILAGLAGAA